jgi:hypothetical protein
MVRHRIRARVTVTFCLLSCLFVTNVFDRKILKVAGMKLLI